MTDEQAQARETERDAAELAAEVERLHDRWLRARADLENYRKRSDREVERRVADARDRLLLDCLEVIDSVDRALKQGEAGTGDDGLREVQEQMRAKLARYGAERVEAIGAVFDPGVHEAVGVQQTDEAAPDTVVDVARAGYRVGERVLRPAQVVVSRRPTGQANG